jgi:hypothetical protein
MAWVGLASLLLSGSHTPWPRLVGVAGRVVVIIVFVQGVGVGAFGLRRWSMLRGVRVCCIPPSREGTLCLLPDGDAH